jgi:prolyl 4-hydroxylase
LTGVDDVNQLEILQVLHYDDGQQFLPHTDGFDGPITACGFKDSGRLVTFFCYLNTVSNGGSTEFTALNLDIRPRQGMAALHFPNTIGLEEDVRTEHRGVPPIDGEKWLLVTWIWKDPLSDEQYNESNLPKLSDDRI